MFKQTAKKILSYFLLYKFEYGNVLVLSIFLSISLALSCLISLGSVTQEILFVVLDSKSTYPTFPIKNFSIFEIILSSINIYALVPSFFIVFGSFFVKKVKANFYFSALTIFFLLTVTDIIFSITEESINIAECLFANFIGALILSFILQVFNALINLSLKELDVGPLNKIICIASPIMLVLILVVFVFGFIKYFFIPKDTVRLVADSINSGMYISYNDQTEDAFNVIFNKEFQEQLKIDGRLENVELNWNSNNLIKKTDVSVSFFINCQEISDNQIKTQELHFSNLDKFSFKVPQVFMGGMRFNSLVPSFITSKDDSQGYQNFFWINNNQEDDKKTLTVMDISKDYKYYFSDQISIYIFYILFDIDKEILYLDDKNQFDFEINNEKYYLKYKIPAFEYEKKLPQCENIILNNSSVGDIAHSAMILGFKLDITPKFEKKSFIIKNKSNYIEINGVSGFESVDFKKSDLENYIKNGNIRAINIKGIKSLSLNSEFINVNKDSVVDLTSFDKLNVSISDENIIIQGSVAYIYLNGAQINKTNIAKLSIGEMLSILTGLITLFGICYKFVKNYIRKDFEIMYSRVIKKKQ